MDGFRRSDHEAILGCLTDDVVWHIHGLRTTHGKAEFDDEIENHEFEGSPELTVDRALEDGDIVVVTGEGPGRHRVNGVPLRLQRPVHLRRRPHPARRLLCRAVGLTRPQCGGGVVQKYPPEPCED